MRPLERHPLSSPCAARPDTCALTQCRHHDWNGVLSVFPMCFNSGLCRHNRARASSVSSSSVDHLIMHFDWAQIMSIIFIVDGFLFTSRTPWPHMGILARSPPPAEQNPNVSRLHWPEFPCVWPASRRRSFSHESVFWFLTSGARPSITVKSDLCSCLCHLQQAPKRSRDFFH